MQQTKEITVPKNVGKYQQGAAVPHAPAQPVESETPHRAAPAGPVPRGQVVAAEAHKSVGANKPAR